MAKTSKKKKKEVKPTKEGRLWVFLRSQQFALLRGVFYMLFAVFALVAMGSYVVSETAGADSTVYEGIGIADSGTGEYQYGDNVCGTVGGWIGELMVRSTFGLASLGFCFLLFVYGMRLVAKNRSNKPKTAPKPTIWHDDHRFHKTLWVTLFWIVWFSTTIGWLSKPDDPTSVLSTLAGVVGAQLARTLNGWLHIGFPILWIFVACAFLVAVHHVKIALPQRGEKRDEEATDSQPVQNSWIQQLFARKQAVKEEHAARQRQEGAEFESDSVIDEIFAPVDAGNNAAAARDGDGEEAQPEEVAMEIIEGPVTLDIDDEFERINRMARGETAGDGPKFTVNTVAETPQRPVASIEEDETEEERPREHHGIDEPYDPRLDLKDFKMPTTEVLEDWEQNNVKVTSAELVANKDRIVETLRNYGIEIVEITASPGPTVTLYEIKPAPGIRISKIKSLEDDIALSLAALGIRIIAPIPGKGTIGIEVPNANPQVVSIKTMLTSDAFTNSKAELPIAFGKTISNDVFVTDLAKMPHLLMAGATGTGKSVGLNTVIASLLYKKHPAELKFVMVDPKKVELSLYSAIERHYLAKLPDAEEAIITDVKKVVRTLNSLCIEMDQRYDLLKAAKVRNLQEYNPKFISRQLNPEHGHRYLPYIVLVIDEFGDLIMTAGKEVELPICRLAQLARAVGIHLIIATQRPTTNIITGAIKANFPARIAFRVISAIDSRTILDTSGANQLIGRGDMLISLAGKDLVRCQCALIETREIEKLARLIGDQRGYAEGQGFMLPEYLDETDEPNKDFDPKQKDEFFNDAARLVVASQFGSTSLLQRKLQLGYNRAGRIIDQLEAAGIVGPYNGSKAREVLIKDEVSLEELLRGL